jgi:hypothetical protein
MQATHIPVTHECKLHFRNPQSLDLTNYNRQQQGALREVSKVTKEVTYYEHTTTILQLPPFC